jgi:hypothetical protein
MKGRFLKKKLVLHTKNELFQLKIKIIYLLVNKAIKNSLVGNIFMKFLTHGNNKMEGIPMERMPLIMVHNTTFHNHGLQNFCNSFTNNLNPKKRYVIL